MDDERDERRTGALESLGFDYIAATWRTPGRDLVRVGGQNSLQNRSES